ncbi:MAG: hypothetical protein NUV65_04155 [Candidatus Roizmanbacteria bacterium]|nr:hypothetical protein [Candidatus Roizmanbacteria bacterium]
MEDYNRHITTENSRFAYQAWKQGVTPQAPTVTETNCGDHPDPQTLQEILSAQVQHGLIQTRNHQQSIQTQEEQAVYLLRQKIAEMNRKNPRR